MIFSYSRLILASARINTIYIMHYVKWVGHLCLTLLNLQLCVDESDLLFQGISLENSLLFTVTESDSDVLCTHPLTVSPYKNIKKYILVPCGKCAECRKSQRDDLAFRIDSEMNSPDTLYTFFVTLTYNDKYLPLSVNKDTGEEQMHVSSVDIHSFFKYFRKISKSVDLKFRYFLSSEYGDKFGRPHYHALFFVQNFRSQRPLQDMITLVQKAWYRGFVSVQFPKHGFSALQYVTKYVIKNVGQELQKGYQKTFTRRSQGLGLSAINGMSPDTYSVLRMSDSQGRVHILPRYYMSHLFSQSQLELRAIHTERYLWYLQLYKCRRYFDSNLSKMRLFEYENMRTRYFQNITRYNALQTDSFYQRNYIY